MSNQIADILVFDAPYRLRIERVALSAPRAGEARVHTLFSAISAGSEMLFYRGQAPQGMALDATLAALQGEIAYPLRYGYACVGRVEEVSPLDDPSWLGRLVFAFQPHASDFIAPLDLLLPVPVGVNPAHAALFPSIETAVSLLHDAAPILGERVAIFGQGVVGLLVTSLLARFPLAQLVAIDPEPHRRAIALRRGAHSALDPHDAGALRDFDLVLELSGNPTALDAAIRSAGFDCRVVVGSWYGSRRAGLDLGGHFHRSRIRLISSQVSSLAPHLMGRWNRERRRALAWSMLASTEVASLLTHRFALSQASDAYARIDRHEEDLLQVLFEYG